jgi:hypothetical protein
MAWKLAEQRCFGCINSRSCKFFLHAPEQLVVLLPLLLLLSRRSVCQLLLQQRQGPTVQQAPAQQLQQQLLTSLHRLRLVLLLRMSLVCGW